MELFHLGFLGIRLLDILDILIVAFLLFKVYQLLKNSAAMNIFIGIIAIYLLWWMFVKILKMQLLGALLGQFMSVGVLALIIVFQQEVRRFLLIIGSNSFTGKDSITNKILPWNWSAKKQKSINVTPIVKACSSMSKNKTGAIIVISRSTDMNFYESTGDIMDAEVSKRLLESIFFKNSPLHDGAVIIENDKIKAARCVLPVTDNTELPAHYGMRHRAAIGITEQTDAISVIVSEETGNISVAIDGKIQGNLTPDELEGILTKETN
jgi:diadenylate cyclase